MCYSREEMAIRVHRTIISLKIATSVFTLGGMVTLGVIARAQTPKPLGERVAVTESQVENNKTEIAALRTEVSAHSEQISTMRGIGVGAFAVLGILDTVQFVLVKRKTS